MQWTYPPAPACATDALTRPSPAFRTQIGKVVTALIGFSVLYIILLLGCLAFAFACGVLAWILANAVRHWMALVLGLGLLIAGLMVTFFVVKFLFASRKTDRSGLTEITEAEYPDLFAFIRRISEETGTRFPKHIYLSPEVNASVFYESSFWSMFFPVRKNLTIGLGLVNMLNMSEFKSVIAHEFGHFSQKSMRAGSFVYQANNVIYNMLYENKSYAAALESWGNSHFLFALCAKLTEVMVTAIQSILREAYKLVNRQYLRLSREMEFHADAMSVKVAGANNAIQSLRRIEFADAIYNNVLGRYNEWVSEKLRGSNIYSQQRIAAQIVAEDFGFSFSGGLPILDDPDKHYKNFNRLSVSDQWASHPTRQQREAAMQALAAEAEVVEASAWTLFPDAAALQQRVTERMYEGVQMDGPPVLLGDQLFEERYLEARTRFNFPAFYAGYYNNRGISTFDPEAVSAPFTIDDIEDFLKQHADLYNRLSGAREDLQVLEQITKEPDGIRSFDFDGSKYRLSQSGEVKKLLETAVAELEAELQQNDEAVFHYFLSGASPHSAEGARLRDYYRDYFAMQSAEGGFIESCNELVALVNPFYQTQPEDRAWEMNTGLAAACKSFGDKMKDVERKMGQNSLTAGCRLPAALLQFEAEHWYFMGANKTFDAAKLESLMDYINRFASWVYECSFEGQKVLLVEQFKLGSALVLNDTTTDALLAV